MDENFSRYIKLIGEDNFAKLKNKKVIVFGVGGVGGFVVECLARCGLGNIAIVDNDKIEASNINRQIIATENEIGKNKLDIMEKRVISICSTCRIRKFSLFYSDTNFGEFELGSYDYVIDCIDTVSSKISLICRSKEFGVPIISAMGAGNKLDPTKLQVSDISKTEYDPLAKVIRKELKNRGVKNVKVVYSKEQPSNIVVNENEFGRHSPASAIFVPASMGILIAKTVIDDLIAS